MLTLRLNLNQSDFELKLLKNGRVIDFEKAKYYYVISDLLLSQLDRPLKKNRVDIKALKSYKILSGLGQDSTSYKIASAFVEGVKS